MTLIELVAYALTCDVPEEMPWFAQSADIGKQIIGKLTDEERQVSYTCYLLALEIEAFQEQIPDEETAIAEELTVTMQVYTKKLILFTDFFCFSFAMRLGYNDEVLHPSCEGDVILCSSLTTCPLCNTDEDSEHAVVH